MATLVDINNLDENYSTIISKDLGFIEFRSESHMGGPITFSGLHNIYFPGAFKDKNSAESLAKFIYDNCWESDYQIIPLKKLFDIYKDMSYSPIDKVIIVDRKDMKFVNDYDIKNAVTVIPVEKECSNSDLCRECISSYKSLLQKNNIKEFIDEIHNNPDYNNYLAIEIVSFFYENDVELHRYL